MAEIQGVCDPRFEAVHQLLHNNLDSGADTGASVAVMLGGELVVVVQVSAGLSSW